MQAEIIAALDYAKESLHHPRCTFWGEIDEQCSYGKERVIALLELFSTFSDQHVVTLELDSWVCEHPLSCRVAGTMASCFATLGMNLFWEDIHRAMSLGEVYPPGKWLATQSGHTFNLNSMDDQKDQ